MSADLRRKLGWFALVGLALAVLAGPMVVAMAGDAGAPAAATGDTGGTTVAPTVARGAWGWKEVFMAMGTCGITIVLLSVAGLALIIDFSVNIRREKLIPPHIISEIEQLFELEQSKQASAVGSSRREQIGSGDRSGRVRTYNFPQSRVTDHRLAGEDKNYPLERVLAGELDEILAALEAQAAAAQAEEES